MPVSRSPEGTAEVLPKPEPKRREPRRSWRVLSPIRYTTTGLETVRAMPGDVLTDISQEQVDSLPPEVIELVE